ncbi:MAG: hypothetical protein Q9222_000161 [Ikaeria aurantiellina]
MTFWTYAEISIGTIVSCLPVLPKFFRHIAPKLQNAFHERSNPNVNLEGVDPPLKSAGNIKNPSLTCAQALSHPPNAMIKDKYLTLDDIGTMPLDPVAITQSDADSTESMTTKRNDLESGEHDFRYQYIKGSVAEN